MFLFNKTTREKDILPNKRVIRKGVKYGAFIFVSKTTNFSLQLQPKFLFATTFTFICKEGKMRLYLSGVANMMKVNNERK